MIIPLHQFHNHWTHPTPHTPHPALGHTSPYRWASAHKHELGYHPALVSKSHQLRVCPSGPQLGEQPS
eukprot:COSAG02_NODE_747_length_17723_cov_49.509816_4_plen_68_part_00